MQEAIAALRLDPDDAFLASGAFVDYEGYARVNGKRSDSGRQSLRVHRLVLARALGRPLARTEYVDHINGDRLDNRRENLRVVTARQNSQHLTRLNKNNVSGYRGVTSYRGRWQARVCNEHLGVFDDPAEAGRVAAARRRELGFLEGVVA